MRPLLLAILLGTVFAGSGAFAQNSYVHHKWCLLSGPDKECAFNTLAQCKAAKHGNTDRCTRNSAPINH